MSYPYTARSTAHSGRGWWRAAVDPEPERHFKPRGARVALCSSSAGNRPYINQHTYIL